MSEIVAKVEKLRKVFKLGEDNIVEALKGIDLDIHGGEYVAIMGASGSGKSTLLNLLGCLDRPSSGKYILAGRDVATLHDDELSRIRGREIGFIFQAYNLIPQLDVVENIKVPLFYQGRTGPEVDEYCCELARLVGLEHRLDHRPTQLSGGQQQRVAIARALVNDPSILLTDEATGNLDSRTTAEIMELIEHLNDLGKTVVMVTHEDDIAGRARRIIRLKDGLVQEDTGVSLRDAAPAHA